jgi:hypothetical protein
MKLFLRIITLFCYFLPFTYLLSTCNRGPWEVTYNKQEGERILADTTQARLEDSIENSRIDSPMVVMVDTLRDSNNNFTVVRDTLKPKQKRASNGSSDDKILGRFFLPTRTSASALGFFLFPENDVSRTLLGLTMIITLASLIVFIVTKRRKITLALLWANLLSLIAFIASCFVLNISLLFGAWVVLILLMIQIYFEYKMSRKEAI